MLEADDASGRQELGHPGPCRGSDNARKAAVPNGCEDDAWGCKPVQRHFGEAEAGDGGAADEYDASVAVAVYAASVVTAGIDEGRSVARRRWLSVRV
jgi:hypothetical protein